MDTFAAYEQGAYALLARNEVGDSALERNLDEAVAKLRTSTEDLIFLDIAASERRDIPEKCWLVHYKIIQRYSKAISKAKKEEKSKPVQLRKLYTYFTKFTKLATKFYRVLIQRLISHFGLKQLKFVAHEFKFEIDPSDKQLDFTSDVQNVSIFLCYEILLHLGDLSRYRENHGEPDPRNPESKNWGPAKGYYSLARKVLPTHPKAFNQLAVLAQYEQNHFTAIYYLYRSLLAEEPDEATHETTLGNLKLCFMKILKDHAAQETTSDEITTIFSRYHAFCFMSNDASEYESLKSDLLNQITLAVKERAVPAVILNRMILINIAAEHLALSRDRATLNSPKVVIFLRFNIETFTSLLMVLQQELDGTSQDSRESVAELVSAVTRRMLPSLRLYSAWLLISHHILVNETNDMSLNVQVKQLWQTYATTLSLLLSTFPMGSLKSSQYLLEEDDDIAGFKPLMDISDPRRLGKELARVHERDHPNQESLARILYLIEDGIELCAAGNVPIDVKNDTFAFQDGIISTDSNTGNAEYPTITLRDIPVNPGGVRATSTASRLGQANHMGSVISEPASTTLTNKMNAMVDDLVGSSHSREDSDEEEDVILWKGRRAFYQSLLSNSKATSSNQAINNATITAKTPMVAQAFAQPNASGSSLGGSSGILPSVVKPKAPIPSSYMIPPQVPGPTDPIRSGSDLLSYVQNYTSRMTVSPHELGPGMGIGQSGPPGISMPQPGPADPVTPKLSSASLERPAQYYAGHMDFPAPNNMATPTAAFNGGQAKRGPRPAGDSEGFHYPRGQRGGSGPGNPPQYENMRSQQGYQNRNYF